MPQPEHSARRSRPQGPTRRDDSTRPATSRSGAGSGAERRPYPTAPSTTRISPATPGSPTARARSRGSAAASTPATVWTAGPAPIDLDTAWPAPFIEKIVDAFSEPGGRVTLLSWPTAQSSSDDRPRLTPVFSGAVLEHIPAAESDDALADALAAVEELGRSGRVVRVAADPTTTGPGARPFWAGLVGDADPQVATVVPPSHSSISHEFPDGVQDAADTDLVITSLRLEHGGDRFSDLVALVAARLLRVGGILVVLTHCDWLAGELIDPTGAVVASAQNADLLYLQHIVALHAPVRGGRFADDSLADSDGPAAENGARARHRASVRGLPEPHRRIHSDVLVFAQPHDHEPPLLSPADAARESGVIR
ncbi:hypothetical protein SAMN04488074_1372 [Lentzea albidocapillata subsp. violacea]|uniref:Methyltransferase domain-containing protein n=1 Tax=Lentzea albidocapillata subsp. violacea TaxID=128104 RepID=A0A1G9Z335_9PSEU|nr:hypothetical protein [Lentzea albidocapillata]SDN15597.1 hypothetical protein SAMN04488074_1372 [Lentzea albidocapillata subsp. violacea]